MVTLVIEGGAMRASYASGVAEALQRAGLVPEAIYGTSAGGAIGAWYAAGQADVGASTWEHVTDRNLMSYRRAARGGPFIDFRRLYGDYYPNRFGMDIEAIRRAPYPVYATVTDADTAETLHVDVRREEDPFTLLHATSAMPLVSESPIRWRGRRVVDGGMTDPIPLRKAVADGHEDILVIANRPAGLRQPEPALVVKLIALRFPALAKAIQEHHVYHNDAIRLAEDPPEGVRVQIVRPTRELRLSRMTRDLRMIGRALEAGRRDGERAAQQMGLAPLASQG